MNDIDIDWQLETLRRQYVERLKNELQALLADMQSPGDGIATGDRATLEALRHGLHRIAGSAGTFGFAQLGASCRSLELQVQEWLDERRVPTSDDFTALLERVRACLAELEAGSLPEGQASTTSPLAADSRRARIAILGDHRQARGLVSTLKGLGYACHWFLMQEAAELERWSADILLIDETGSPRSRWVKALASLSKLPTLLLLSDEDTFQGRLDAVRHEVKGYFTPPLDMPALEQRIRHLTHLPEQAAYRVLIVDDDAALAEHYRLVLLASGIDSQVVDAPSQVLEVMHTFQPDVVLIDINMPGCSGPELARVIRLDEDWLRVPLIYLSVETDAHRQALALAQAGDDFLCKPISDEALSSAMLARAKRSRQLSAALDRDGLTGLMKHSAIKEMVEVEIARARRSGVSVCVAMLDIDHFKTINDTYGHAVGDQVIRRLSNLLKQQLRRVDHVGRYGGEEFVAVLPSCTLDDAYHVLERMRRRFQGLECVAGGQVFHATFSAGVASVIKQDTTEVLLDAADLAMYRAKRGGRNRVVALPRE